MPQGRPEAGERYRHFKNKMYQVIGTARHSETGELLVVYQALYGEFGWYVRPYEMFVSEVDHEKYPEVSQTYRFEYLGKTGENLGDANTLKEENHVMKNIEKEQKPREISATEQVEETEEMPNPILMAFLEADSYAQKYDVLKNIGNEITDRLIDDLSASLDVVIPEGTVDTRYTQLKNAVATMSRYETTRFR